MFYIVIITTSAFVCNKVKLHPSPVFGQSDLHIWMSSLSHLCDKVKITYIEKIQMFLINFFPTGIFK